MIDRRPGYSNQMMSEYCQSLLNVLSQTEKKSVGRGKTKKEIDVLKYRDVNGKLKEVMDSCEYYKNRKDSIELRPYQQEIVDEGFGILNKHRFLYLAMEVRTGKTLTSLAIAEKMGASKVLFITKKKAIDSIKSDHEKLNPSYALTVINYESLHHLDDSYDLIICDEAHSCLLGDTEIDGVKIKDIQVGHILKTFNIAKGIYEYKKVAQVIQSPLTEKLVKIKCDGREIICTESHRILTDVGFVEARNITTKHKVQVV